jgi:uncharacterized membrane protein
VRSARYTARALRQHVRHHGRFYTAIVCGVAMWLGLGVLALPAWLRLAAAGDVVFLVFLVSISAHAVHLTPDLLRKRACYDDEGVAVILLLTVSAFALCAGSLVRLLGEPQGPSVPQLLVTILSVPLAWLTLHTIMAFRYAHLFYTRMHGGDHPHDAEGLVFPGTPEPTVGDFLYYSFVVGMTAQVSDVQVTSGLMRRATLVHGIISFFYNAVLLALAVNVAAGSGH